MARARTTLGVFIDYADYLAGGYETRLRAAFEAEARRLELDVFIFVGRPLRSPEYDVQNGVFQLAHGDCIDGVILVTAGLATYEGVEGVERLCARYGSLPLCSLGLQVPGVPSVVLDNRVGMEALVEHLIDQHGCRRLAFISGPKNNPDSLERKRVVAEVLSRHGLPLDPDLIEAGWFTLPSGIDAMSAILDRTRDFDAVVAANDGMALGAQEALKARGLRVPHDMRVVGFDDLELARFGSPPLTTASQPLERMAALAVERVLAQLRGESVPLRSEIGAELVLRRSCGCSARSPRRTLSSAPFPMHSGLAGRADHLAASLSRELACLSDPRATALQLVTGLVAEADGRAGAFLWALEGVLEGSDDQQDLHERLQEVITLLRSECAEVGTPLEDVWHEARVLIARCGARANARQRMNVDVAYWHLLRSGERLLTAFDLPSLRAVLAEVLPAMRVRNAVFSLYRDASRRELEPFLCLRDGLPVELSVARFPASQLVPPGTHAGNAHHVSFVWPLAADFQHFGVAVLEAGPEVGAHEMLGEQVSAALKSAALHREIVHRTALHERSVQERLASAKRMSAISVLAGGVAHDLNNSLGPLVALPDIILRELDDLGQETEHDQTELRADVMAIKSAALRAAQTIRDLLTSARQGRTQKESFDLNRAVESCVTADLLVLANDSTPLDVALDLCSEPLFVVGSESQVGRAISNLLRNAAEATSASGCVRVRTSVARLAEPLMGYETVQPGEYAVVTVTDTGRGIPPLDLGRVFEPFFTKKRLGESSGSGLGLAIVHGVVKEHDGFVNVESRVGDGTTFSLYFARGSAAQQPREEVRAGSVRPEGGPGRILVVDDDPVQLRTAQRVLERAGHHVTTARGGREALRCFEDAAHYGKPSPFDLLVLDMVLNEADDGLIVFERIGRLFPEQRCVIVSGHAPSDRGLLAVQRGLAWVGKPYTRKALTDAVASALRVAPASLSPSETPPNPDEQRRTGT